MSVLTSKLRPPRKMPQTLRILLASAEDCRPLAQRFIRLANAFSKKVENHSHTRAYTARDALGAHYSPGWAVAPPWRASYK